MAEAAWHHMDCQMLGCAGCAGGRQAVKILCQSSTCSMAQVNHYHIETELKPPTVDRPQYGGNHYKLPIEPIDFIMKNGLGFCEGNIIKYVTRHKAKGTPRADLLKARQYIDFLLNELPDTEENN